MSAAGLAVDTAAWASPWRYRAVGDKAILCLGLAVCALALPAIPASPVVIVVVTALALGPAGLPAGTLLRVVRAPAAFIALAALPVAISVRWSEQPGVQLSAAGLSHAVDLLLHGLAGSSALLLLAATTPMCDLLAGTLALGVPAAVVEVALVMYRMVFLLGDSVAAIRNAQAARLGYASWRAALRSTGALTAAILIRAFDRARRLESGLAGRGGEGSLIVTTERRPSSRRFVVITLTGLTLLVVGSLAGGGLR